MIKTSFLSLFLVACANQATTNPTKDQIRNQGKADDGHDWCAEEGWYGDGVCDEFCLKQDPDCATDDRAPELKSPTDVLASKISMHDALVQATKTGPVIEAKFEPDDSGKLSLSTYPVGKPLSVYPTDNVLQELAGDPTATPWAPSLAPFHDFEHLCTSTRDLTLRQLSAVSIEDSVDAVAEDGAIVYWTVPTIQEGRAGYGVWALYDANAKDARGAYTFVDGGGSDDRDTLELGAGPGSGATDPRVPELAGDPTIVRTSAIKMSDALRQLLAKYPAAIEAKFEIGDDGKLSLSIYTTGQPATMDAKRNTFFELAGDPTQAAYAPSESKFDVPDEEHVTKAARDLTLIQTQDMPLLGAVEKAESLISGGIVYWAIPTIRGTRAGYGVYILAPDGSSHYYFLS
ncbi:MAG: hypothetical protein ACM31C_17530 [Acidobacteriota bacterium]